MSIFLRLSCEVANSTRGAFRSFLVCVVSEKGILFSGVQTLGLTDTLPRVWGPLEAGVIFRSILVLVADQAQ